MSEVDESSWKAKPAKARGKWGDNEKAQAHEFFLKRNERNLCCLPVTRNLQAWRDLFPGWSPSSSRRHYNAALSDFKVWFAKTNGFGKLTYVFISDFYFLLTLFAL